MERLLMLKFIRNAVGQDSMLLRYFEMLDKDELLWNGGNNLALHHLLSLADHHDQVLSCEGRQPCGKVRDVVQEAIPAWHQYDESRKWIHKEKSDEKFKSAMKSQRKWAITRPMFKGAMGCCLWTLLAYWPSLKFTSIQQVQP
jgi:hypothetical protein